MSVFEEANRNANAYSFSPFDIQLAQALQIYLEFSVFFIQLNDGHQKRPDVHLNAYKSITLSSYKGKHSNASSEWNGRYR